MTDRLRRLLLLPALLAAGCMPGRVRPAELMLERTAHVVSGDEVGDPLGVGQRLFIDWLALSASTGSATTNRVARPCGGFVHDPEGDCVEQLVVQRSSVHRLGIGVLFDRELGPTRLLLIPYAGLAALEHEEVGHQTGARRAGDGGGPQLGAALGVQYNLFGELYLGILADAALILPLVAECDDCYEPFRDDLGTAGLSVTASWRLP